MLTMLSTIPPMNAAPKLSTRKPGTMAAANSIIRALITSQKIPKVSSVSGKVMILRKMPRVALTKPISNGLTYTFTFNFARAGQTTIAVPVYTGVDAPRQEQGAAAEPRGHP